MGTNSLPNGTEAGPVIIRITPTVAKDHELRGVFPSLRPEFAMRKHHNGHVYSIERSTAELVLEDAEEQSRQRRARELTLAYNRLCKGIRSWFDWCTELARREALNNMPSETPYTALTPEEVADLSQVLDAQFARGLRTVTLLPTAAAASIKQRKLQNKSYGAIDARELFLARMREVDQHRRAENLSGRIADTDDARLELRDMIVDLLRQVDKIKQAARLKW